MGRATHLSHLEELLGEEFHGGAFSYYQRLDRVQRYVVHNHTGPISLADAAHVAGMERTAFSKFFRCKTGVPFRDWLATIRVAEAMELMASSNFSIREIAIRGGFHSVRSFERIFLRVSGSSPIDYKNSVRPS